MSFLSGKKTYIIAALMVLVALVNLFTGSLDLNSFLNSPDLLILLNGFGLAALRAGIAKVQ